MNTTPRIPYRYKIPPSVQPEFSLVEKTIRTGELLGQYTNDVQLGRLGDGGKHRPTIKTLACTLELSLTQHLLATFWPDPPGGIPSAYTACPPDSHSGRHFVAFVTSHVMRVHLCPISAPRTHPRLGGSGIMIGMVAGQHCMMADTRGEGRATKILLQVKQSPSFAENLLFNAIIGSGQRLESSLMAYKESCWSTLHPEAFTFTETQRLAKAFSRSSRAVRRPFWNALEDFSNDRMRQQKIHELIREFYGERILKEFTSGLDRILGTQLFDDENILVIDEE